MKKAYLALFLLVASLAYGGSSNTGGSGGSTTGTANRCARFDTNGNLTAASGDCTAGDSNGTVAAFSGITAGTNSAALVMGSGSSLTTSGNGQIQATYAAGAGALDMLNDGGSDPALTGIGIIVGVAPHTTVFTNSGGKLIVDTTVAWPVYPDFTQIAGVASVGQIPHATAALFAEVDPPACAAHKFVTDRTTLLGGPDTCTQPAFTDISGVATLGQLPTVSPDPSGSFTNMACNVDAWGRVSGCTSGSSAGEANTASSLGGGLAVFDSKSGVDLRFNTLASADFALSAHLLSLATDVVRSARTISTTGPLQGGGDLSANRTLSIQADGITHTQIDETDTYSFGHLAGSIKRNDTSLHVTSCTGLQGSEWYDTTDSRFKFCDANSGTPTDFSNISAVGDVTDVGDCTGGACFTGASGTRLRSNTDFDIRVDSDNNGSNHFGVENGAGAEIATIDENGAAAFSSTVSTPAGAGGGHIDILEPSGSGTDALVIRQTSPLAADVTVEADSLRTIEMCQPISTITLNTFARLGWVPGAGASPAGGTLVKAWCVTDATAITTAPNIDIQRCAQDGSTCVTRGSLASCGATGAQNTTWGGTGGAALAADSNVRAIVTNSASVTAGVVLVCVSVQLL